MSTNKNKIKLSDHLKASESCCEYLDSYTTAEDLITFIEENPKIDKISIAKLLSMMKKAAYYNAYYDQEIGEIVHEVWVYSSKRELPVFSLTVRSTGELSLIDHSFSSIEDFDDVFGDKTLAKLKNFKCLHYDKSDASECKKISDRELKTKLFDLLQESEQYCRRRSLTGALDLLQALNVGHSDKDDENSYWLDDKTISSMLRVMKDAAYYEARYNKETEETIHYAISYGFDHGDDVYLAKLYERARKRTMRRLTLQEFYNFFKNAGSGQIKNFKSLTEKPTSTLVNLLKASEEYCERNELTTNDKIRKFILGNIDVIIDDDKEINDEKRATLLSLMKNSAYYESKQNVKTGEIVHHALTYDARRDNSPITHVILGENTRRGDMQPMSVRNLNLFLGNASVTQIKNFKCLQNNQEKKE